MLLEGAIMSPTSSTFTRRELLYSSLSLLTLPCLPFTHLIAESRLSPSLVTDFSDNASGPSKEGTLRYAVEHSTPNSTIHCIRPGTIELARPLEITTPGLTISGIKNPVVILGDTIKVKASDVKLEHLWIFAGDRPAAEKQPGTLGHSKGSDRDALVIWGGESEGEPTVSHVHIDHCWLGFGIDECVSTYGKVSSVTLQNSIIGYGLNRSIHAKDLERRDVPGHGKGMLIGRNASKISVKNNLFVHNFDRNICVRGDTSDITFEGNTIYNWGRGNVFVVGDSTPATRPSSGRFAHNVYISGRNSEVVPSPFKGVTPENTKNFLVEDNIGPLSSVELSKILGSKKEISKETESALSQHLRVIAQVGPHPGLEDRLSLQVINDLQTASGQVIDYLESPLNREARIGLSYWPTLERIVSEEKLKKYAAIEVQERMKIVRKKISKT